MNPIPIDHNIPVPPRSIAGSAMSRMREALSGMKPGDSFIWTADNKHPFKAAKQVGCRITTKKLNGNGWRVWRIT